MPAKIYSLDTLRDIRFHRRFARIQTGTLIANSVLFLLVTFVLFGYVASFSVPPPAPFLASLLLSFIGLFLLLYLSHAAFRLSFLQSAWSSRLHTGFTVTWGSVACFSLFPACPLPAAPSFSFFLLLVLWNLRVILLSHSKKAAH